MPLGVAPNDKEDVSDTVGVMVVVAVWVEKEVTDIESAAVADIVFVSDCEPVAVLVSD